MNRVGVVIIGRNEGRRLARCLSSLHHETDVMVYVDSGSTDGSPDLAQRHGAEVVACDPKLPFTAARARNLGFAHLVQHHPEIRFVQFVDGDCEVSLGWLAQAAATLAGDPKLAAVFGRRRERFPRASIYNRLCDIEWNTPVGLDAGLGGDAQIRVEALKAVGGYNPSIIAAED